MSEKPSGKPRIALIHLGAPKTATTTLQGWLRGNRKRFTNRGVGIYLPRKVRQNKYIGNYMRYYRGKTVSFRVEDFLRLFEEETAQKIILSEEALTNDFIPAAEYGHNGFTDIDRTISFIKALGFPQTRILLTIRRQDKFLKSAYSHRVRRSSVTKSFEDWLEDEVDLERMSWLKVVNALDAAFGPKNVTVVPFEMLEAADEKDFYLRCISPLGMDFSRHTPPKFQDENSSLAEETLEIAGILNALETKDADEIDRRRKLITSINRFVLDNGGRSFKVDLKEVTLKSKALFQRENAKLAARKFPDLVTSFTFPKG